MSLETWNNSSKSMPVVTVVCTQHHSKIKANTFIGYRVIKQLLSYSKNQGNILMSIFPQIPAVITTSKFCVISYITDLSFKALTQQYFSNSFGAVVFLSKEETSGL